MHASLACCQHERGLTFDRNVLDLSWMFFDAVCSLWLIAPLIKALFPSDPCEICLLFLLLFHSFFLSFSITLLPCSHPHLLSDFSFLFYLPPVLYFFPCVPPEVLVSGGNHIALLGSYTWCVESIICKFIRTIPLKTWPQLTESEAVISEDVTVLGVRHRVDNITWSINTTNNERDNV